MTRQGWRRPWRVALTKRQQGIKDLDEPAGEDRGEAERGSAAR